MTNAEKFKEVFDIEVVPENTCLSESCLCHECSHHDGTRCHVEDWWYAEYQGEPTVPLKDLISREEALMALTGVNLPTDRDKLIALYDKRIKALQTVEAVPLSVIGDIKAEIERESDYKPYEMYDMKWAFNKALGIIDKAVKECTHE